MTPAPFTRLHTEQWQSLREEHRARAQEWTEPCRDRLARGTPHPVHDFLTTYYRHSLGKLETWHPGPGVAMEDAPRATRKIFRPPHYALHDGWIQLDPSGLGSKQRDRLSWIRELLAATRDRPGHFACHGIHEWAMVYRGHEIRHGATVPLRLPQAEIDAFVESHPVCCTHFDAFRFFAPEAKPRNKIQLDLWSREDNEQPGCLHANMDLYKWASKAMPWIGSELLWSCFQLALEAREIDMRASAYDLSGYGYTPIPVETEAGRRDYETAQRTISERAAPLRQHLISTLDKLPALPQNIPANS